MSRKLMYQKLNKGFITALIITMLLCNSVFAVCIEQTPCTSSNSATLAPRFAISGQDVKTGIVLANSNDRERIARLLEIFTQKEWDVFDQIKIHDELERIVGQNTTARSVEESMFLYLHKLRLDLSTLEYGVKIELKNKDSKLKINKLQQELSQAKMALNKASKRVVAFMDFSKEFSVYEALKMVEGGAVKKLAPAAQFAMDVLDEEMVHYPEIDYKPEEILFVPSTSWLCQVFDFKVMGAHTVLSLKGPQSLILINGEMDEEIEVLKTILHEIAHKGFIDVNEQIAKQEPRLMQLHQVLEEVRVEELNSQMLKDFYVRNKKVQRAAQSSLEAIEEKFFKTMKLPTDRRLRRQMEKAVLTMRPSYVAERGFRDMLIKKFGIEMEKALNGFLHSGGYMELKQILGDDTWEQIIYILNSPLVKHADALIKDLAFGFLTKTIAMSGINDLARQLKVLAGLFDEAAQLGRLSSSLLYWRRFAQSEKEFQKTFFEIGSDLIIDAFQNWLRYGEAVVPGSLQVTMDRKLEEKFGLTGITCQRDADNPTAQLSVYRSI